MVAATTFSSEAERLRALHGHAVLDTPPEPAFDEGAEAVSIYSKHAKEIALVLTDMMMPVMDGPATIQVLRRLNPAAKIIAASALNATGNVAKAANLGVTDFPAKPCTAETMLGMFREVLDRTPNPAAH